MSGPRRKPGAGRKPKPTALKHLAGNPGKRELNENEPTPKLKAPRAPAWLDATERKAWRRWSKALLDMGVLAEVDGGALALLVFAECRFIAAKERLQFAGEDIPTTNGNVVRSPAALAVDKAFEEYRAMLTEFGLTPSARTRVTTVAKQDTAGDPVAAKFFSGPPSARRGA